MRRTQILLTMAMIIIMVIVGAGVRAQPTSTTITPGSALTVTCTTSLDIKVVNTNTLTIACAPGTGATATVTRTATSGPIASVTPTRTPTTGPTPTSGPPVQTSGIWISAAELASRPMSGASWLAVKNAADGSLGTANISDQDSNHDVNTLAVALVYARTGTESYRLKAKNAILSAIGTEAGGRTLALGRNLSAYVISADLIGLSSYDPAGDGRFRTWLSAVRQSNLDGRTLISTHEDRPNNWGTHAGASRIAADLYLGDTADLNRAATVFRGFVGDRSAYAGFDYGDLSWQCNPSQPVGINPACTRDGHSLDGALPDDMRRGGSYTWPPSETGYPWEAMQGIVVQTELLRRAGFDSVNWQNRAVCRAAAYLNFLDVQFDGWWAEGDDTWQPHLINRLCGTSYPVITPARPGKNIGWTDWTR